jgi:nicotinate-nucleotide pyrophosphorylase (carboxylating)
VALNFVSRLSGIATLTRKFVQATRPYKAKIMDTRKTTPALRALEKYAVRIGGGLNHRFSLDEMIMVKDNHLKVMGDKLWVAGFKEIKNRILRRVKIEIEVNNLREFKKALNLKPDIIMLDNMNIKDLKMAVRIRNNSALITPNPSPKLEASGGINLKNVRKIASLGIDMISVGDLTHSPKSIDMSLQIL